MISNLATAMEKDGVALTRFFMMVEREYPEGKLTELELSRRLRKLRLADPSCVEGSLLVIIPGSSGVGLMLRRMFWGPSWQLMKKPTPCPVPW